MAHRWILTTVALGAALSPLAAQTPRFNGEVFDTGSSLPNSTYDQLGELALFDVQPDGHPDAFIDTHDGLVLMLGTADGSFGAPQPLGVDPYNTRFRVEDIDLDGDDDLLLLVAGSVYVFSRDGLGGLQPVQQLNFGLQADWIELLDLEGDGDLDVVGGDFTFGSLTTWFHDGSLGFTQGPSVASDQVECLAAGDVDEDGDVDVLVTSFGLHTGGYRLTTWLNDGAGELTPGPHSLIGINEQIQTVDLDEDGHLDVVAPVQGFTGGFRVLHGDGGGHFSAPTDFSVQGGIDNLLLADADGDGQLDLIGTVDDDEDNAYGRGQNVFVRRGLGAGAFGPVQEWSLGPSPVHVAVADLDGQGSVDLVVSIPMLSGLAVLHGEQDGGLFAERIVHHFDDWTGPAYLAAGDLDLDGDRDLVVVTDLGLVSLLSDGGTGLTPSEPFPAGFEPRDLKLGDLNGDGVLDAVIAAPVPDKIIVRLGDGAGGWTISNSVLLSDGTYDVELADMTGDGVLDLVAATSPITVAPGLGNGLFGPQVLAPSGSGGYIVVGDLDGDGHLDVVTGSQNLHVSFGDGSGALSKPDVYDIGIFSDLVAAHTALVDADRDGDLDVLLSAYTLDEVLMLENDGSGQLSAGPISTLGLDDNGRVVAGDVTGDGLADIVIHTYGDGVVHVAQGLGDGSFAAPRRYLTQGSVVALVLDDFDGDLRQDVLVSTYYKPDTVAVLRNLGPEPTWASMDGAIAGSAAPLLLQGSGPLTAGSATELRLTGGDAFAIATLVIGFSELSAPFKSGLLVPSPDLLVSVPLDASGALLLQSPWPAGVPAATALFWQGWMADAGAPLGLAASNGVRTLTP